jgi:hypothetical protein
MTSFVGFFPVFSMIYTRIACLAVFVLSQGMSDGGVREHTAGQQTFPEEGDASMSCERCGGFKVFDYFDGPFHCSGYRCINCGAITDMRIAMATQTRTVVPPRRTKPVRGTSLGTPQAGATHPGQTEHQP